MPISVFGEKKIWWFQGFFPTSIGTGCQKLALLRSKEDTRAVVTSWHQGLGGRNGGSQGLTLSVFLFPGPLFYSTLMANSLALLTSASSLHPRTTYPSNCPRALHSVAWGPAFQSQSSGPQSAKQSREITGSSGNYPHITGSHKQVSPLLVWRCPWRVTFPHHHTREYSWLNAP